MDWLFCIIAFFEKKHSREKARAWMCAALVVRTIDVVLTVFVAPLLRSSIDPYSVAGTFIALGLMIIFYAKLKRDLPKPSNEKHISLHKSMDRKSDEKTKRIDIDYAELANKIFDISLELSGLAKDGLVKNGAFYLDPSTIQTSSMYGTGLYEYSMLLLRERMRKIYTDKHTFEAEDNKMVEVFANKLMVPSTALLKIIDRNGGAKSWEKMLLQDDSVPMDEYINEVKVEVNRATRDLIISKTGTGLVETGDSVVSKPKDDVPEDDFDDGL